LSRNLPFLRSFVINTKYTYYKLFKTKYTYKLFKTKYTYKLFKTKYTYKMFKTKYTYKLFKTKLFICCVTLFLFSIIGG